MLVLCCAVLYCACLKGIWLVLYAGWLTGCGLACLVLRYRRPPPVELCCEGLARGPLGGLSFRVGLTTVVDGDRPRTAAASVHLPLRGRRGTHTTWLDWAAAQAAAELVQYGITLIA